MTKVLIVCNSIPGRPTVLADTLQHLHSRGVAVTIACGCPPGKITVREGTARVMGLRTVTTLPAADRAEYRDALHSRKLWLRCRRDQQLRRAARSADVLVAMDPYAVHTVWQLARRHRAADAVVGLAPALAAVAKRDADPIRCALRRMMRRPPSPMIAVDVLRERADRLAQKAARRASGRRILGDPRGRLAWRLLLSAPGLSDDRRTALGERVATRLLKMDLPGASGAIRTAVGRRLRRPATKAEWLNAVATAELTEGRTPSCISEATAAELELADRALARDDFAAAAGSIERIIPLLFHRAVHFDSLDSPMARNPSAYLAPLRRSAVARALATPRGRCAPAVPPPANRPHRLLFLTRANEHFLDVIHARYKDHPDFEVRRVDLVANAEPEPLPLHTGDLIHHLLSGRSDYGDAIRKWFAPHVEWADTIFVDWCLGHAALLTTVDPGSTRIIVRLHSFEAFTVFPHLIDLSRVDDLVFVSEPLRDLTSEVVPMLNQPGAPRTPVLTNAAQLDRYQQPKTPDARFTLGLVGVGGIAKDPRWAFQVLRELRRRDERYRLVLIGKEIDGSKSAAAAAYHRLYAQDLAELEAQGAVRRIGQTDDVPAALTDVGVILSSSVRESFHLGLVEGAASGALPVVRDWPFFAGRRAGARSIFPADWIVPTPPAAAARILELTSSEELWRKAGAAAADHAMAHWDWSVTRAGYDNLLLPG